MRTLNGVLEGSCNCWDCKAIRTLHTHAQDLAAALAECLRETNNNMSYEDRKKALKRWQNRELLNPSVPQENEDAGPKEDWSPEDWS